MSYFAKITTLGLTRLAEALASNTPIVFTHVAVGDGGGSPITPDPAATALTNEVWRGPVNQVSQALSAPNAFVIEAIIPALTTPSSFTIREAGIFNGAGELLVIASYPPIYKPDPDTDGAVVEEYVRIVIEVANATTVAVTVDDTIVTASREYVDDRTAGGLWLWENFT